jgi:hypothetical protein
MSPQPDAIQTAAIISAFTSLVALAVSLWSAHTARQSLKMSQRQLAARSPNLDLYFHNGYIRAGGPRGSRIFALSLSVSNLSDADNSLSMLGLSLRHHAGNGLPLQSILPHGQGLESALRTPSNIAPFRLPVHIGPHQTVSGWALFEVPDALVQATVVDHYALVATDTHKLQYFAVVSKLTEIMDGHQGEESRDHAREA